MTKTESYSFWKDLFLTIVPIIVKPIFQNILDNIKIPENVKKAILIGIWVWILVAIFLFIRNRIVAIRLNKQKAFPMVSVRNMISRDRVYLKDKYKIKDLFWEVMVSYPRGRSLEDYKDGKRNSKEIKVERIDGPFCPRDKCELNEEITYFGKYNYVCPYCGYKEKRKKSTFTLMNDVEKIVERDIYEDVSDE